MSHSVNLNKFGNQLDFVDFQIKKIEEKSLNFNPNEKIFKGSKPIKIHHSIKILKKSLKKQTYTQKIDRILDLSKRIEAVYTKKVADLSANLGAKQGKKSSVDKKIVKAWETLDSVQELQKKAVKRAQILNQKENFKTSETSIPRMDHWLAQQKKSDPQNKNFYETFEDFLESVYLKNQAISYTDIHKLEQLVDLRKLKFNSEQEKKEFQAYITEIKNEVTAAYECQTALLLDLQEEFLRDPDPDRLKNQNRYAILCRQIFHNPLGVVIIPDPQILKPKFWNFCVEQQKLKLPYTKETLEIKLEGLQRFREYAKTQQRNVGEKVLISGAGPGGLMAGLFSAVQGKDVTIIEARRKNDPMRENILALGKEGGLRNLQMLNALGKTGAHSQADLKILDFFGITDALVLENKIELSEEYSSLLSITLKDLQEAAIKTLKTVTHSEDVIHYDTVIDQVISPKSEEEAVKVIFKASGREKNKEISIKEQSPTLIYGMEGGSSSMRDLLGIEVDKLSKAEPMAFGFFQFKKESTNSFLRALKLGMKFLKTFSSILKFKWVYAFKNSENISAFETYFQSLGKAELLLSTPGGTYAYATLTEKEKAQVANYEQQLKGLGIEREEWANQVEENLKQFESVFAKEKETYAVYHQVIHDLKPENRATWFKNSRESSKLFYSLSLLAKKIPRSSKEAPLSLSLVNKRLLTTNQKIKSLQKKKEHLLNKLSTHAETRQDVLSRIKEKKSTPEREYQKTMLAYSQVKSARSVYRKNGKSHFYVGGDAESTTDPISGSGCRTTLLRVAIATSSMSSPTLRNNKFAQSAFELATYKSARSMREEGLSLRHFYRKGTHRLERFTNMASDLGILNVKEQDFLIQMEAKAKMMETHSELIYSSEELAELNNLQAKIKDTYSSSKKSKDYFDKEVLIRKAKLSSKHNTLFRQKLKQCVEGNFKHNEEEWEVLKITLERLSIAYDKNHYYLPEVPCVYLNATIARMQSLHTKNNVSNL